MGWSIGWDSTHRRWVGYGVPAFCDHPGCGKEINRGVEYACGKMHGQTELGCALYFCPEHLAYHENDDGSHAEFVCASCRGELATIVPAPEHPEWLEHVLADDSWQQWRDENPEMVNQYREQLAKANALEAQRIIEFIEEHRPTITSGPEGWAVTVRHTSLGIGHTFRQAILETMDWERLRKERKQIQGGAK